MAEERDARQLRDEMQRLIWGYAVSQALYAVAALGVAEQLESGPKTAEEIAEAVSCDSFMLDKTLRALAFCDVVHRESDGRFSLTPLGSLLSPNTPGNVWDSAMVSGLIAYEVAGAMLPSIKTGVVAFEHLHGRPFYEYLFDRPDVAGHFNAVMSVAAPLRYADVPSTYDFSSATALVDVGGGNGGLTRLLLEAHPHLRAMVFDLPEAIVGARAHMAEGGLTGRCEFVAGSFFDGVPSGGDLYVIANVFNNFRDTQVARILENCRAAMGDEATLLIVDGVTGSAPPGGAPPWAAGVNLETMTTRGGGEPRDEERWRAMLRDAGFRLDRITPLARNALIEARPGRGEESGDG